MRILFFAHQNWGVKALQTILKSNHELIHLFVHPENMNKHEKQWYDSVQFDCEKNNILSTTRTRMDESDVEKINEIGIDDKILLPNEFFTKLWSKLE